MNPSIIQTLKDVLLDFRLWLSRSFDHTAAWVSKLSWWKFFVFTLITLTGGAIVQDTLFPTEENVVVTKSKHNPKSKINTQALDGDTNIEIDNTGIHIKKTTANGKTRQIEIEGNNNQGQTNPNDTPTPPTPADSNNEATINVGASEKDIHIALPPDVAKEIGDDINNAVADAADEEVRSYKKTSSKWFMNFVLLAVFGLFGMKMLMGGKFRAEEKARTAGLAAERESLLRQVSEAKMQMMQAQVEPHFLFNTLASVEYLIETDPPRASAMQRSLIKYLRAVLPQMRENALVTNLGREADMVVAYLNLLKMRMEERLTVDFDVPEGLRTAAFPPMMLQSMVENAIKHGLEGKPEGGTLRVRAEVAHSKLRVIVADDGLGFGAKPSDGTGLGLLTIRERLKLLHGDQGQLHIEPNTPSGVIATIEVPYQLSQQAPK